MALARGVSALGVGQQFTGGFVAALGQLRCVQYPGSLLRSQFGDPLLIQGHVQGGTVFFLLATTAAGSESAGS